MIVELDIGGMLMDFEQSPFLLRAYADLAKRKFPLAKTLQVYRHGALIARIHLGETNGEEMERSQAESHQEPETAAGEGSDLSSDNGC